MPISEHAQIHGHLAPRETLAGPGTSGQVGSVLRARGVAPGPVLVVADAAVTQLGLLADLLTGLHAADFVTDVFDQVSGEPGEAVVDAAAAQARERGVTAVIGIGGGSAMDAAKVAALLATNLGAAADHVGVVEPQRSLPPLVLVPTTSGTGSEASRIAMVTVGGVKRVISCSQFVPSIAVLDEQLVTGLPSTVVAATGMDALAHAIESMLSTLRTPFTMALSAQAITMLRANLEPAVAGDGTARGRTLYAAHLAGIALNAGVVLGHSLAYVVARRSPLPHGTCCALALPYCLAYNAAVPAEIGVHLAELLTGRAGSTPADAAQEVAALTARLGLPGHLSEIGIRPTEVALMAAEIMRDYPRPNNPVPLTETAVRDLLTHMVEGDLSGAWASSPTVVSA
ncbi:iron-containing alcohol dehydrogenase [Verrucosispora sp. WMMC514]|uniref:iron-containing alcohol dehydrogenase family protein n=1 Tax=Verrucosispora sp. WMMC514 TaxID=3015156 RepID=UPI00248BDD30|nr:iron-containing alcohol dehydrogenase [Verrucosispora sp. WMMC514]WBB89885.1 iron-containing alcohol dehydrogenase [Verrucosispora sp. WMMC514]